jgi:hypothetical protein
MGKNVKNCFDEMTSGAEVKNCKGGVVHWGQQFFSQCGIYGYQKKQNIPFISKI